MDEVYLHVVFLVVAFILLAASSRVALGALIKIARSFKVSEFAISFIVVGLFSAFPELSIGINSAFSGVPSFGLGVILGSNVADMTLILGLVAVMANGIKLHNSSLQNAKFFILTALLPILLLLDGEITQLDGLILIAAFLAFARRIFFVRKIGKIVPKEQHLNLPFEIALLVVSLAALLFSGYIITDSSKIIGTAFAIPVIFLGIVLAIGTCLPELSIAIGATKQKHGDVGFGGIVGNVLADCMATLGIVALIRPIRVEYIEFALVSGLFTLLAIGVVLTIVKDKQAISRREGLYLIGMYFVFLAIQYAMENAASIGAL